MRSGPWPPIEAPTSLAPSAPATEWLGPLAATGLVEVVRRIPGRNRTKADVVLCREGDRGIALKTYERRPAWVRHTLGRWAVGRETAAYRAAGDLPGLPKFFGRPEPWAIAVEWVSGRSIPDLGRERVEVEVFDEVAAILDRLHRHGVALADLHHRNVLVTEDGSVILVDLAAAVVLGEHPGALRRALFRRLAELDLLALTRMRARWTGGDVDRAVTESGGGIASWHRRGRKLKRVVNALRRSLRSR